MATATDGVDALRVFREAAIADLDDDGERVTTIALELEDETLWDLVVLVYQPPVIAAVATQKWFSYGLRMLLTGVLLRVHPQSVHALLAANDRLVVEPDEVEWDEFLADHPELDAGRGRGVTTMPSADERIAKLEAKVTTLEEQMEDLAEITGSIIREVFGDEMPVADLGLRWTIVKDDGEDVGLWALEETPMASRS